MFYLRTGGNGSCKTLFTLKDVRDLQLATGRPVAWNGRFKLYPEKEKEFGWKRIEFKNWWDEQDGTIFLIDEAYHDLPVRPNGQQPPLHIARLAEHRARGFDFFMLCLHPSQIDPFVRKAIQAPGYHQHLKRVGGASNLTRVFQWDAVNDQCQKDGSGKTAQVENRLQPKEVYTWYDSAFIHTGKVRIPKQVWWFVFGLLLAVVLGFFAYRAIAKNVFKGANPQTASKVVADGLQPAAPARQPDKPRPMTVAEYVSSYEPRIPALQHTAPAYDELTKPKRAPVPAACVSMPSKGCKCFTQDGTPYPVEPALCASIVRDGIFLPFAESAWPAPAAQPVQRVAALDVPAVQPKQSEFVAASTPLLPPPDTRSTVERDAEVIRSMRKRDYVR